MNEQDWTSSLWQSNSVNTLADGIICTTIYDWSKKSCIASYHFLSQASISYHIYIYTHNIYIYIYHIYIIYIYINKYQYNISCSLYIIPCPRVSTGFWTIAYGCPTDTVVQLTGVPEGRNRSYRATTKSASNVHIICTCLTTQNHQIIITHIRLCAALITPNQKPANHQPWWANDEQ